MCVCVYGVYVHTCVVCVYVCACKTCEKRTFQIFAFSVFFLKISRISDLGTLTASAPKALHFCKHFVTFSKQY